MCSDMSALEDVRGLKKANATHSCPFCKLPKTKWGQKLQVDKIKQKTKGEVKGEYFFDIPEVSISTGKFGDTKYARSVEDSLLSMGQFGYKNEPILDFIDYKDQFSDPLHLFGGIAKKLIELINNDINELKKEKESFDSFFKICRLQKITNPTRTESKKEVLRELRGPDKKKLFNSLKISYLDEMVDFSLQENLLDDFNDYFDCKFLPTNIYNDYDEEKILFSLDEQKEIYKENMKAIHREKNGGKFIFKELEERKKRQIERLNRNKEIYKHLKVHPHIPLEDIEWKKEIHFQKEKTETFFSSDKNKIRLKKKFDNVNKIWKDFFYITNYFLKHINIFNYEYLYIFQKMLKNWLQNFLSVYFSKDITPYIHVFTTHLPELIFLHQNYEIFTCEGIEKLNEEMKMSYRRNNNRHHTDLEFLKILIQKIVSEYFQR